MNWARHPILCLYRCPASPLSRFTDELLVQEGYLCFDSVDLDEIADLDARLAGRALVIVRADSFRVTETETIRRFVRGGGSAILIKPATELIDGLSLAVEERPGDFYSVAPPGYLQFNEHPWVSPHAGACIQCHAPASLWRIGGVRALANVATQRGVASSYPAIIEAECGDGRVAIVWLELGTALVRMRQGNPKLASTGDSPDADGDGMHKPSGLFYGHLDFHLKEIPQADVLADVMVGVIRGLTDPRCPLPRLWHLPNDAPAVTLLDGDSDSFRWDFYDAITARCAEHGVPFTLNLHPNDFPKFNAASVEAIFRAGNDLELHYWLGHPLASVEDARRVLPEQHRTFQALTGGRRSVGSRGHSGIWPGYTEMAGLLADEGFRLDTNFFPLRGYQWGFLNGSARAARFHSPDGRRLGISQQATVLMDDCVLNEKSLLPAMNPDEIYEKLGGLYERAVSQHAGVVNLSLHPSYHKAYEPGQDAILQAAFDANRTHGVPALTVRDWVAFQEARRQVDVYREGDGWCLKAGAVVNGLTCRWPGTGGATRSSTYRLAPGQSVRIEMESA
jgi:hypothetical protein